MKNIYLENRRRHRREHPGEWIEYYRKNKEEIKSRTLLRRYGIDSVEYNRLFNEQNGCCAICGKHQSEFKKALHVDHNHTSKEVRGLLCYQCNAILGMLEDSVETLKKAILYLNKDRAKQKEE